MRGIRLKAKRNAAKNRMVPVFVKKIKDTIERYDMLRGGERVLAAVSGGPDSVAMLMVLADLRNLLGIEIVVGNIDHGIRGAESERDSRFVKELAKSLDLEFVHEKMDLAKKLGDKMSVEEKAREKRYGFLAARASEKRCDVIATGHTLDDQAETVLMRVVTGTSPFAISGIPPVRDESGIKIIRPLIRVEKSEILEYLFASGCAFVEDSSNKSTDYNRNKFRLEIIPFLEKYNPKLKRSLANLADGMREELAALQGEKNRAVGSMGEPKRGTSRAAIADMILQPKAVRKEIFKELLRRAGGNIKKLTYRHWMEADKLLSSGVQGKSLDLPGDVRVTRTSHEIVFEKR